MAKSQSITELQLGKPHYIYIVEDLERKGFKIGVTTTPDSRFRQLQIATSSKLKMLGWWRGTREDEDAIKAALHCYRGPSEWFNTTLDVMIETVARYCRLSVESVSRDIVSGVRAIQPRTAPLKKINTGKRKEIKRNRAIEALPIIPKVFWEAKGDCGVVAWYIPRPGLPQKRWICLGYADDAQSLSLPVETWARLRIITLDLDRYDPDRLYREWLKMERG